MMLVEALLKLAPIAAPHKYQYVGFGGLEFIDFHLMHRRLGITKMFSIESNTYKLARYKANCPYKGIRILSGRASDQLTAIKWKALSIVWLDYTIGLNREVIADVEYLCRELLPGSFLALTLNAQPRRLSERRAALADAVGEERVPLKVTDNTLGAWGLAKTQHEIISAVIKSAFAPRTDRASWRQVLNIHYRDDAKMQLIGGVIGAPGLDRTVDSCTFGDLDFIRFGTDSLVIEVPHLTPKERRGLNEQLPQGRGGIPALPGLTPSEVNGYVQIYRRLDPMD